jgi:sporulation protein YlmC with PRC-barrel domain
MASLGLPPGSTGVARAYSGLLQRLVVDTADARDAGTIDDVEVVVADTRITDAVSASRFVEEVLLT